VSADERRRRRLDLCLQDSGFDRAQIDAGVDTDVLDVEQFLI
jgi:hypothetical protein